ncbi:MAG: hypothetical protein WCE82_11325 [Halobacteriota archaeon]
MEARKQELHELSKQQRFPPVEEVATFNIIKNLKELVATSLSSAGSIKDEGVFVFPARVLSLFGGATEAWKEVAARGVYIRGIADISCKDAPCTGIEPVEPVQEFLDIGADMRYLDHYHGLSFAVSNTKTCFSVINGDVRLVSRGNPLTVLWIDDRAYAGYLTSTFELLWAQKYPKWLQVINH